MPLTILDQINSVLFDRLTAMVDDPDYEIGIVEVIQPTRVGEFSPRDRQILLVQGDDERVEELDIPGNPPGVARRQTFNVRCHLMPDETSGEDVINQAAADIITAITTPNAGWHHMDGLAIDSQIGKFEYVSFDGGPDGVNVPVQITYRVSEYSPFVSRL
jgi:hypothetical protein